MKSLAAVSGLHCCLTRWLTFIFKQKLGYEVTTKKIHPINCADVSKSCCLFLSLSFVSYSLTWFSTNNLKSALYTMSCITLALKKKRQEKITMSLHSDSCIIIVK